MVNEKLEKMVKSILDEIARDPYKVIENSLDVVLEVGTNPMCELRGWRIYVTLGGPTIYITPTAVVGVWGGERVEYPLPTEVSNALWVAVEQMFPLPVNS